MRTRAALRRTLGISGKQLRISALALANRRHVFEAAVDDQLKPSATASSGLSRLTELRGPLW
jgi:hypothetical protein